MGYSSVKLYKDMVKALRPAKTIRTKVTPVSSAPATGWQAADRLTKKALELYLQSQKEEKEKQDISARMRMFRDYNKPQAKFDPSKYGQTPDQLRDTGYMGPLNEITGEGYEQTGATSSGTYVDDEPTMSGEQVSKFFNEEAADTQNRFDKENPYGMDLVNSKNYNSVDTNSSLDRFFGMEKDKVEGPQTSEMRMVLMGDSIGRREAETERLRAIKAAAQLRTQGMEDFKTKAGITAQYKDDPYQRPYDTTAGMKNAGNIKRLHIALKNAVGPEAKKLAKQDLSDFEYVLSKDPTAIGRQAQSKARGSASGKETAINLSDWQRASASMPELQKAVASLRELSKTATYTMVGKGVDFINKEMGRTPTKGAVARSKTIAMIKNNVLPLLRQTFGAAFTAAEGDSLLSTFGDPDMTALEKDTVLDALIESKVANLETKRRLVMMGGKGVSTGGSLAPPPPAGTPTLADIAAEMKRRGIN